MKIEKILLPLFIILSSQATFGIKVCPTNEAMVAINIGFNYHRTESGKLPGVNYDILAMKKLTEALKPAKAFMHLDQDITSKEAFLIKLQEQALGKPIVFFNYAGHGFPTEEGEFAIQLPINIPTSCVLGVRQPRAVTNFYRNTMRLSVSGQQDNESSDGPKREIINDLKYDRIKNTPECRKYYITASEIAEVFKGKRIYGLIDSCFSGALKMNQGMNFIYSTSDSQIAQDGKQGGFLFNAFEKMLYEYSCDKSSKPAASLNLADLMDRIPAVYMAKESGVSSVPIEEAQKQLIDAIMKWQQDKNSKSKQNKMAELIDTTQTMGSNSEKNQQEKYADCIQFSKLDPKKCEEPTKQVAKLNKNLEISCQSNEFLTRTRTFRLQKNHSVRIVNSTDEESLVMVEECLNAVWIKNDVIVFEKVPFLDQIQLPAPRPKSSGGAQ